MMLRTSKAWSMRIVNSKYARWCITAVLIFIIGFATGVMTGTPFVKSRQNAYIDSLEKVIEEKDEEISDIEDELDDNYSDDDYDDYWDAD